MKPRGYLIYRGPSRLTGEPIIAVAIAHSNNEKTGDLVQTYILTDTVRPTGALMNGADEAVCGDCKHRPLKAGGCYVVVRQGSMRVWLAYRAGRYPDLTGMPWLISDLMVGRVIRLGTYGDPAAVPLDVWTSLVKRAAGWIGYTHQWHREEAQDYRSICMASVDTPGEKVAAIAKGWRTFRVRMQNEPLEPRESVCPASEEAGHKVQCIACQACNGAQGRKGNIAIVVHGAAALNAAIKFKRSRELAHA